MATAALPLSEIVQVTVLVSPQAATAPTFNHGLVMGTTVAAGYASAGTRILELLFGNWSATMLSAGFTTSSPEYIAMQIYFGQEVPPQVGWVGLQNPSSLLTVIPHSGNAGTNYTAGDVLGVTQGGASGGQIQVVTVGGSGNVTAVSVMPLNDGTGYTVATALATTNINVKNPAATGLEVDISAIGETPLGAVTYLRSLNQDWYGCMSTTAVDSDHEAIAGFVQSCSPPAKYYWGSATAAIVATPYSSTSTDVASYMKTLNYQRSFGVYSTTQGGNFPNNVYVGAAVMGVEMGLNTGLASSYYTTMFKVAVGIAPEPLTQTQITNLQSKNCNVISNFQNEYEFIWNGKLGNGWYSDLVTFLDVLTANIQINLMNLLTEVPAVPLTDAGEAQLIHAVNQAAQQMVQVGFISPGTWEGVTIQLPIPNGKFVGIQPGDPLSAGYYAFAQPFVMQTAANRAARQAMPIYLAIIATDAAQSVAVGVYVQS